MILLKKLIIILGDLASGKSTLARVIANKLNSLCLVKDDIKELLGDRIGFHNRDENLKLSQATFDIMKYVVRQFPSTASSIVLESNFRPYEIKELNALSVELSFEVYMIVLTGDPEVLYTRYVSRNPERHIVHQSVGLVDRQKFFDSLIKLDEYHFSQNSIVLNTTNFTNLNLPKILKFLNE